MRAKYLLGKELNKMTIKEAQEKYAKHCGHKNFEELRENNEEALKVWYLNMI